MKTIEFHILQNFPPSNLNRDDSGAPKDCDFGGYRRQRISSQCFKRAVRQSDVFRQLMTDRLGIRTKRAPEQVAQRLVVGGYEAAPAQAAAEAFFDALYGVNDKGQTDYLLYVGAEELNRAATLLLEAGPELSAQATRLGTMRTETAALPRKEKEAALKAQTAAAKPFADLADLYKKQYPKHVRAVDVALFGRMLADNPTENVDAACQVSHALSVNRLNMEFDYFTAVDDLQPADSTGAGMIGTVGFASSCFYRFASLNLDQLIHNLGGDAAAAQEGVLAFAEAFVQALPSGKQNTFAAHALPALVMVIVREAGQPVSLVNAFESPIRPSEKASLSTEATRALARHYEQLRRMFGLQGTAACVLLDGNDTPAAQQLSQAGVTLRSSVPELFTALREALTA